MKKLRMSLAIVLASVLSSQAYALDLVREGKPVCTIVLPAKPNDWETQAAQTLVKYFRQVANPGIRSVKEPAQPADPVISVGHTDLAAKAGLTEEGLRYHGCKLLVKDNVLYLLGRDRPFTPGQRGSWGGTRGTYNAALTLLELLGWRWVVPSPKGLYVPELRNGVLSVPDDLDLTKNPAFMYGLTRFDRFQDWSWAHGFCNPISLYTEGGHTWETFVPASNWKDHPDYFMMDKKGKRVKPVGHNHFLCPSHPDVVKLLADGIRQKFDEGYDLVQLGQSDGFTPCHCPKCKALGGGYKTEQVHVCHNKVMQEVYRTHPDKQVLMIVYGPTRTPSRLVEEYPPNCVLELAGSDEGFLRRWAPKAPGGATAYVYFFGTYQRRGLLPKQSPRLMGEAMKARYGIGIRGIDWCGGAENWLLEGPTYYTTALLNEDPAISWKAALNEYCSSLYGPAAGTMEEFYKLIYTRFDDRDRALLHNEAVAKEYPPQMLEKADTLMAMAREQAQADPEAANWVRCTDYGYRYARDMARAIYLYNAYEVNRTMDNLKQVRDAVVKWRATADEIAGVIKNEKEFVRDYWPLLSVRRNWQPRNIKTNANQIGSPFKWDFDAIIAAGLLPGKDRRSGVVPRLDQAPKIDGALDDAAWENVEAQSLYEISMGPINAPTEFKMGYDDKALYLAFKCEEPLIDRMAVREVGRDGPVWRSECVEVFLDPEAQGAKRMHFIASPWKTGFYDGRFGYIDDPFHPLVLSSREDTSWDPEWTYAFQIDKPNKFWTLEMAIPFTSIDTPVPKPGERWRVNFARERNKQYWGIKEFERMPQELYLWSPNLQKASFLEASAFGDLYFGRKPAEE